MMKLILKTQVLIEALPWYVYASIMMLGLYNIFHNGEDSVIVVCNVIGISCMIYVVFHNWEIKTFPES